MAATKAMDIADDFTIVNACASWFLIYDLCCIVLLLWSVGVMLCVVSFVVLCSSLQPPGGGHGRFERW